MFKGVGVDFKDFFEQFRKNKSYGFIVRMKVRDEMREKSKVFIDIVVYFVIKNIVNFYVFQKVC